MTDYVPERNTTFVTTWDGDEDDDPFMSEPVEVDVPDLVRAESPGGA